jgi:hypothetical protein
MLQQASYHVDLTADVNATNLNCLGLVEETEGMMEEAVRELAIKHLLLIARPNRVRNETFHP